MTGDIILICIGAVCAYLILSPLLRRRAQRDPLDDAHGDVPHWTPEMGDD
ncbi:hypothetical protein V5G24_20140 [Xanthobacter sp. VTT E-85241]|jgi:hypothetical protein